jgi:hypothetical protein
MFVCSICGIALSTVYKFKQHILTKNHIANLAKQPNFNSPNKIEIIPETSNTNTEQLIETKQSKSPNYCCKYCSNSYYSNYNLKRHYETCKKFAEYMATEKKKLIRQNMIDNIVDNIQIQAHSIDTNDQPINIIINNNIVNNTLNGNLVVAIGNSVDKEQEFYEFWNTVNVNPVGFEDTGMLSKQEIADKIHGGGLNAFVEYVRAVYSNKKNHNVGLFNKREKLVKYITANGDVEITTLNKMLDLLVMNNIDGLDVFLDRKDISIKKTYKNIIDKLKFIHEQDGENPYLEKYIKELYLIILNISRSALAKISKLETMLTNTSNELALAKSGLVIPRTDYRTIVP